MSKKLPKSKYWIFYSIFNGDLYGVRQYEIYAFTDNINLAEEFVNTRNMNMELELFEGLTKNSNYKISKFNIPITRREKLFLQNNSIILCHEKLYEFLWKDFTILSSPYKKAFKTLLAEDLSKMIYNGSIDDSIEAENRIQPDEFNILMWLFKDVFIPFKEEGNS